MNIDNKKIITIDCRMVNASGIGTYLRNILPLIICELNDVNFFLLGDKNEIIDLGWNDYNNIEIVEFHAPIYSIKEQLYLPFKIPRGTTIFWSPHYNVPILFRGKLLVTVMDLAHLALNSKNILKKIYSTMMFTYVKYKADTTMYISKFSRKEFNKYVGLPSGKQYITLLGINKEWYNIEIGDTISSIPFLLYVGNVKPHKNLGRLIDAFKSISDKIPHNLVIVGKKEGFITGDNTLEIKIKDLNDRIIFTGHISNTKLKQYYKQADIFLFPSLYEGFGFPPLEAMAAGTPVISSNAASLSEICGDAVLYFDPMKIKNISHKILEMINDEKLKIEYINRGRKHVKFYDWNSTSSKTINIIQHLI